MNYYYFLGWTWEEFVAYVKKNYDYEVCQDVKPAGKCLQLTKGDRGCIMLIWVEKKTDYPSLAHECLHAANWTLERAGWHPSFNDEPQTYLMTNIMRQALGK